MNRASNTYSFLQLNTLAKFCCNQVSFPRVNPNYLDWDYRKKLFKELFEKLKSDIICLEEVDQFEEFKNEIFSDLNFYEISYFQKGNSNPQGTMLLVNKNKFKLISSEKIKIITDPEKDPLGENSTQFFSLNLIEENKISENSKKNIIILLILHLKAKKDFENIRVMQANFIFQFIENNLIEKITDLKINYENNNLNFFFAGDFNTEPDSETIKIFNSFDFSNFFSKISNKNSNDLENNQLSSSYDHFDLNSQNYSNCTTFKFREKKYLRVIDYIFHSKNILNIKTNKTPDEKYIKDFNIEEIGFPSKEFPSDHYYLLMKFKFKE